MGHFDSFYAPGDDETEHQTKGTGRGYRSYRAGDQVRIHAYDPTTDLADEPLTVTDFAVAALGPYGWQWAVVRDGEFTGLLLPEDQPPDLLPLYDNTGQPHPPNMTLGRGSRGIDPASN